MSAPFYMNVWENDYGHQWVDSVPSETFRPFCDRDFVNRVAVSMAEEFPHIRRVATLRVTPKAEAA